MSVVSAENTDTLGGSPSPGNPPRRRREKQGRLAFWLLLPAAVAVFGVIIYPIIRTLFISFFEVTSALATDTPFVGIDNYVHVLTSASFWDSMGRTLYFTIVSTALELTFGLIVAGLLNAKLKARWLFRAIVVIPWAIPTIVNAAMWKGIFNAQYGSLNALLTQLGIIDEYQAWLGDPTTALNMVILADVWKTTPLVAFFLLAGLTSIPPELYEAAKLDRARWPRIFRSVVLPMLVPSISIVLVLRTVEAFKVFDIIYAMTRGGPANGTQTVAYYAYTTAFSDQNFGVGSALSYIIVVVILALSAIYLRLLRRSEMSLL
ncbi:carbohydrate ABC transporter membrane protein 1, CUT1 family [Cryobacterium psychrotolerans]|uniref:Carbohydrate ABC transporter membrane protein 1, CUT1 family n=1 Tax=Cryobacterium psychrotolerans TaxID=386301 RepID=A0A1G9FWJ4_9MICO|nr:MULTISPECIES: sugar ABC transporter permease [Cryobacterium]TFD44057.1 sugar ABC transporter permease [Cryobacterium sp. TMT1-2-1]TFD90568.1 sugar ABC transporter permease [Cryobacterium psychrotolerans]SDK92806.1 carbohydrate ABC transporter membrane protein 1, CUT1 family [Cryobacterium psychrotolerans]